MSDMYNYRCEFQGDGNANSKGDYTDWVTGVQRPKTNGTTSIMGATCEGLHILDRFVMFIEFIAFFGKNIWFVIRIRENTVEKLKNQTHFMNVGGLQEFSLPEQLTWLSPEDDMRRSTGNGKKKKKHLQHHGCNIQAAAEPLKMENRIIATDVATKYIASGTTKDVEVGEVKTN